MSERQPRNYCRTCGQDFASVEAFDYHLPPAHLSPQEERLVHPDTADHAAWGLRNEGGRWSIKVPGTRERLRVKPRGAIWPERLKEVGLG